MVFWNLLLVVHIKDVDVVYLMSPKYIDAQATRKNDVNEEKSESHDSILCFDHFPEVLTQIIRFGHQEHKHEKVDDRKCSAKRGDDHQISSWNFVHLSFEERLSFKKVATCEELWRHLL